MPSSDLSISLGLTACDLPRSMSETLVARMSLRLQSVTPAISHMNMDVNLRRLFPILLRISSFRQCSL